MAKKQAAVADDAQQAAATVDAAGRPSDAPTFAELAAQAKQRVIKPKAWAVEDKSGNVHIVKAVNPGKAKLYIANEMLKVSLATMDQIFAAGGSGGVIHDATKLSLGARE